jgi:dTDP-4-amino-4,6-dideoxygalactose transaminase
MTIPLVNLAGQCNDVCEEVLAAIENVVRKANFILGSEVGLFEEEFAQFCGAADCVSVANGCEALHLSLRALDIGPGDEVITAANTFVGTAFGIVAAGATPVFVDIDPEDFNLDANLLPER